MNRRVSAKYVMTNTSYVIPTTHPVVTIQLAWL